VIEVAPSLATASAIVAVSPKRSGAW